MKAVLFPMACALVLTGSACEPSDRPAPIPRPLGNGDDHRITDPETPGNMNIRITVGTHVFTATLANNATATAFEQLLPMTVDMNELNGNEKYHYLPHTLPVASACPGTIKTGELMLYGSDCLVLFYRTLPTPYSYTRLGAIDDPAGLQPALAEGSVTVTFERASH